MLYLMTSVKISENIKLRISQKTLILISMGHGIKEEPMPTEKLHNSQLGDCQGSRNHAACGLWPDDCLIGYYAVSQWVWVLEIILVDDTICAIILSRTRTDIKTALSL